MRGTVQADILKEDQAQNTCIFSTEFALRMMGDVQQYFIERRVRNFYSVSISGYHIAEAGANPISQLAFTLANGFTIVEYYLARGMKIDDFAPNLSFFFSNGMDPEYAVIGRVARRIWARAMRERYQADARSQMLKYHVQTSGRSLHAREISFNDIRTTLQALYALFDNCNSLHTNAYDEALTTPTEESVRRAVAIQLIINRELGLNKIQNPWQGSFAIEYLTDLVEEAVYKEFEALSERGGVLGAMETMYQRGKIQEESLYYETRKHDGSLPIVGVNTFLSGADAAASTRGAQLIRSTEEEKQDQVSRGACLPGAQRGACTGGAGRAAAGGGRAAATCSPSSWSASRSARWGRSRMRCIRWAVSIVATCEVRLPERGEHRRACALAQQRRHSARPASTAAASGGRISMSIAPGRGQAPLGGSARRVPRSTAGTSGQPARAGGGEGAGVEFEQPRGAGEGAFGEEHQRAPLAWRCAARAARRAAPRVRSKRSTNSEPSRRSSAPASGTAAISRLMTKPKRGGSAAVSTMPSR